MEDEIIKLDERENGRLIGLEVTVLDYCLRKYSLPMKKWKMKTNTYNLVKEWNKIASTNNFEEDQELHIWSFRASNIFALKQTLNLNVIFCNFF